jgi:23S rRNA (uracil1939-C5)-methyltransferase
MKKVPAEIQFLENIAVIDIAEQGKGVGKHQDLVLFIDKAVPGDVVDVQLTRVKKNLAEAKITAFKHIK